MKPIAPNTIIISPIGEFAAELSDLLGDHISRIFGLKTRTLAVINDLGFALDTRRHQYHSTPILSELAERVPERALKILGITRVDLFIPILTFVYGEAQLGGKACLVSTCRLNPEASLTSVRFKDRLVKESIHELGHTFKLRHCPNRTCIMHYCRSIEDVDRKSDGFCRYCSVLYQDELKRLSS